MHIVFFFLSSKDINGSVVAVAAVVFNDNRKKENPIDKLLFISVVYCLGM